MLYGVVDILIKCDFDLTGEIMKTIDEMEPYTPGNSRGCMGGQEAAPQMNGIPLESGVNDCYWVCEGKCTNPRITHNNIPSAFSRDWESHINCVYTICGVLWCGGFEFARERQISALRMLSVVPKGSEKI